MQFSNFGALESHGFARNRIWEVDASPPPLPSNSSSNAFVDLILRPTEDDLKTWPYKSDSLELALYMFFFGLFSSSSLAKKS